MSGRSPRTKKKEINIKKAKGIKNENDSNNLDIILPYDVLRIIFANLLARDLSNAAMVSRLWQEVAEYELKHRKLIMSLVDYDVGFGKCEVKEHFSKELTNKPMLGLFFNGSDCNPPECLGNHLPRSCVSVTVVNSGIIKDKEELESCDDRVAFTLLPDDSKVDIEFIVATSSQMKRINRKMDKHHNILQPHRSSYVEPIISDSLKRLKDIKCMIIFTSSKFRHSEKLYNLKVFKDNLKVAWGGVAEKLFICQASESGIPKIQELLWLTILISGPDVKCWSTCIHETVSDKESIAVLLSTMKQDMKLQRHTIGFMFTCISRGTDFHDGESNVESKIFKTIFPDIPLIGSFGDGEYGIYSEDKRPFIDGLHHQYSTTFMILTYG